MMDSTERQFMRLTQLVLDGIATDAEIVDLARLSASHPENVSSVVDELMVDALLKWQSGSIKEDLPFLEGIAASSDSSPLRAHRKSIHTWSWMIAASVLVATGVAAWKYAGAHSVDSAIADIVYQQGVVWSDDSTALATDNAISRGRLSSMSGEYTLKFRDGSTVRVEGRASLDIKSKMLVQLDHGQATADVPEGSEGFTITSALVDVIDQGTQFGISVDDGRADVIVFDGKVDLRSKIGNSGGKTRLTQGDGVQVDEHGMMARLADVRRDAKGRWWTDDRSESDGCVIARVADNIHFGGGGKRFACYQTTIEGLYEDVIAYSDNPNHQWNGLTADGIPEFLLGADYIRTFNHYRYMPYFKMTIEFSRPANLYVFADDRIPPPAWLTKEFEDTGFDIGLDEGPWLDNIPPEFRDSDVKTTAVGAGNSIDNVFSVWRRRCADGKPVTLGNAGEWGGEGGQGRAMYGVAATPLDAASVADEASSSSDGT